MGYHRAGFDVIGVDIRPQPNYPFEFVQADALAALATYPWWPPFQAIHASPPCQHYSQATAWRGNRDDHPDLIAPTRDLLEAIGLPYVIENVEAARNVLRDPVMICGDDVGLPIHRRRYFETNWPLTVPVLAHARHERRAQFDHGATTTESECRDLMGCDWMTAVEARQAIPPAFTELIGSQLLAYLEVAACA
jgi:DNA (cytosine-5)-methyltransferase 1